MRALRPRGGAASRGFAILGALIASAAGIGTATSSADRCSMLSNFGAAQPTTLLILAEALPDSGDATIGDATWRSMARNMDARPANTWAQRFRIVALDGPPNERRPTLRPGDTIQIAPWGYAADCTRIPWTARATWVTDSLVVFRLGTPRDDTPVDGPMTFDVLGWREPYPSAAAGRARPGAWDQAAWLPARTYYDFVRSLPRTPLADTRSPEAVQAIFDWATAHPESGDKLPIPQLVR